MVKGNAVQVKTRNRVRIDNEDYLPCDGCGKLDLIDDLSPIKGDILNLLVCDDCWVELIQYFRRVERERKDRIRIHNLIKSSSS